MEYVFQVGVGGDSFVETYCNWFYINLLLLGLAFLGGLFYFQSVRMCIPFQAIVIKCIRECGIWLLLILPVSGCGMGGAFPGTFSFINKTDCYDITEI